MLKEKLEQRKCFPTAWGKLITEEEAYRQLNRQIAAMTANLFQVMRIFEPSWEKRTEAICDIANMMNMAVAGTPEEQKDYVNASLYEAFNIPELCEKSSWLGGITGDSGDEWENMAGRGAHRAVGMLEIFLQAVEVQRLAVERNFDGRHDLLVLVGQAALLLAERDVGLAEQLFLQVHGDEILLAELPLNVRAEGAGRDGLAERDLRAAERGERVLEIRDLRFVKFVARVERMADVCDGILRGQLAAFAVDLKHQRAQRGIAFRVLHRVLPRGELCAARF